MTKIKRIEKFRRKEFKVITHSNARSCCVSIIVDPSVRWVVVARESNGEALDDCALLPPRFVPRRDARLGVVRSSACYRNRFVSKYYL